MQQTARPPPPAERAREPAVLDLPAVREELERLAALVQSRILMPTHGREDLTWVLRNLNELIERLP